MPAPSRHADLLPSARRWQKALDRMRDRIFAGLGDEANALFDAAAVALDLDVDDELELDSPFVPAVVADYALYDVRPDGRNALERYRDLRHPARASKDGRLLEAMAAARCSVYRVLAVEAGVGFAVSDLLGGPERFVVEPDLAAIAEEGTAFITRLADLGEVVVIAGPTLPLGEIEEVVMRADLGAILPGRDPTRLVDLTPDETARLDARLYRVGLDVTTASLAEFLDSVALAPPEADEAVPAPPRIWLPGESYELPDLGAAGRGGASRGGQGHLRALPTAAQPAGPLIVPSRPSLVPPPAPTIQRAALPQGEHRANLTRYLELRKATADLQNRIVETLSKLEFEEAGTRLGLLEDDVLVLGSEHEMDVLADFAVYDLRLGGPTAVEGYLEERRPKLTDEERTWLEAMVAHRYAIVMVEGREHGVGVAATDLLGGPPIFLYDVNMSHTAAPGLVLATRLIAPEGLTMTTGAALPLLQAPAGDLEEVIQSFAQSPLGPLRNVPAAERAEFHQSIILFALEQADELTLETRDANNPDGPREPSGLFGGGRPLPRVRGKTRPGGPRSNPGRPKKRRR